jgi:hypothetical protein
MPRIISFDEKLAVIDDWLHGESRNNIARKQSMGSGTVYNILQEWSNEVGAQRANSLRIIAIKLKKNELTVSDCAKGLRMLMIFRKYGIKDDDDDDQEKVIHFLKEVYTKCQEVGLTPQQVFVYIIDILNFSVEIPISQIPQYLKNKKAEKEDLESTVQKSSGKIKELAEIQYQKEQEIQRLSKMEETMTKTYKIFNIAKFQLAQYGIGMENIDQFVKCVVGISKENYNHVQIVEKIADYENLEKNTNFYKSQVNLKKDELAKLNQQTNLQQNILNYWKVKSDIINELEIMGFGINELRTLSEMLNKIGEENNESFDGIRKQFFNDLKKYEDVIASRKEIDRLKNEIKNLEVAIMKEREKYNAYPNIIERITRFLGAGIYEDDIVKIDKILTISLYY